MIPLLKSLPIALVLTACSLSPDQELQPDEIIVGGSLENRYPAVGFLMTRSRVLDPQWYGGPGCTVALISDNAVVTAAHCIEPGRDYAVGFGWMESAMFLNVRRIWVHPSYNGQSSSQHDVAVLALDQSLPALAPHAEPLTFGQTAPIGSQLRVVGYGRSNPGPGDQLAPDESALINRVVGERKSASYRIDAYVEEGLVYSGTGLDGDICNVDSGGPLLDEAGTHVYAVASRASSQCDLNSSVALFSATDTNFAFLSDAVAQAQLLVAEPAVGVRVASWDSSVKSLRYWVDLRTIPVPAHTQGADTLWQYENWNVPVFDLGPGGNVWVIGAEKWDGSDYYSPVRFGDGFGFYRTSSLGRDFVTCSSDLACGPGHVCHQGTCSAQFTEPL